MSYAAVVSTAAGRKVVIRDCHGALLKDGTVATAVGTREDVALRYDAYGAGETYLDEAIAVRFESVAMCEAFLDWFGEEVATG